MTALAADAIVPFRGEEHSDIKSYPVADNVKIYKGSLVSIHAGYAVPAADTSGDLCAGVAMEQVDNTTTGHSAGRYNIRVRSNAHFLLVSSGLAQTDLGAAVVVTDSATVAKTSVNSVKAGRITQYDAATAAWVYIPTPGSGFGS